MKKRILLPLAAAACLLVSCKTNNTITAKDVASKVMTVTTNSIDKMNTLGLSFKVDDGACLKAKKVECKEGKYEEENNIALESFKTAFNTQYTGLLNFDTTQLLTNTNYKAKTEWGATSIQGGFHYNHTPVSGNENAEKTKKFNVVFNKFGYEKIIDYLNYSTTEPTKDTYINYIDFQDKDYSAALTSLSEGITYQGFGKLNIKKALKDIATGIKGDYKKVALTSSPLSFFNLQVNAMSLLALTGQAMILNNKETIQTKLESIITAIATSGENNFKVENFGDNATYTVELGTTHLNYILEQYCGAKDKVTSGLITIKMVSKDAKISQITTDIKELRVNEFEVVNEEKGIVNKCSVERINMKTELNLDYSVTSESVTNTVTQATSSGFTPYSFEFGEE